MRSTYSSAGLLAVVAALTTAWLAPAAEAQPQRLVRPDVPLPGGELRSVILRNCTSCHGIDDYAYHALDRDEWRELLDRTHAQRRGVVLAEEDEALLLDYLAANFGPDSIPFPRQYTPPEITEFFADDAARLFLNVNCTSCHSLDRVYQSRYTADRWRVFIVEMSQRAEEEAAPLAVVPEDDRERLVEWLGRVRGVDPVDVD